MRFSISALSIASCLGVILSAGAAAYTSTHYLALSYSANTLEFLTSSEDVMAPKIEALLAKHENKSLILGELKARYEQNATLRATLAKMVAESKRRAIIEATLWICAGVIFFVFLVRAEKSRRHDKEQTTF
jgi:hypothetical protein